MKSKLKIFLLVAIMLVSAFSFVACSKELESFNIKVNVWYANYGMVEGGGDFLEGKQITIKATPKNNSTFIAWIKDSVVVSYDATYTFTSQLSAEGTYTAVFTCPELELISLSGIFYQEFYDDNNTITKVTQKISIGSSYDISNTVFNDSVTTETLSVNALLCVTALNKKNTIYVIVEINYEYVEYIDETSKDSTLSSTTFIEINLSDNNLETQLYNLNTPATFNGEAKISFKFSPLTRAEEETQE